jgi:hypothetical protein
MGRPNCIGALYNPSCQLCKASTMDDDRTSVPSRHPDLFRVASRKDPARCRDLFGRFFRSIPISNASVWMLSVKYCEVESHRGEQRARQSRPLRRRPDQRGAFRVDLAAENRREKSDIRLLEWTNDAHCSYSAMRRPKTPDQAAKTVSDGSLRMVNVSPSR